MSSVTQTQGPESASRPTSPIQTPKGNLTAPNLDGTSEEASIEELELETEPISFEEFRLFALEFLYCVGDKPGDSEETERISDTMTKYRTDFENVWLEEKKNTASIHTETDADLWPRLERASKLLARLHNRRNLNERGKKRLKFVSKILLRLLRDRVRDQLLYIYAPLNFNPEAGVAQIRVLHLLSGRGEVLQCRIEQTDLASASFVALSYEWGPPDRLFWIEVIDSDGHNLGVIPLTDNLHSALCNIRDSSAVMTRSFWIDQISINQDDQTERGHQVNLMGKIYTAATRVISYLGPQDVYDEDALELLEQIHEQFKHLHDTPWLHDNKLALHDLCRISDRIPEELRFKDDATESTWQGLAEIVCGPWTRRLWMVQETCLNLSKDDVLMLRGERSFPFTIVAAARVLDYVNLLPSLTKCTAKYVPQSIVVLQCWDIRSRRTGRSILSASADLSEILMDFSSTMEFSDPRDRIFALLGLASDVESLGIVADYSKSYEDVLLDVTVRMMSKGSGRNWYSPLSQWSKETFQDGLRLPSWVCRWPDIFGVDCPSRLRSYNAAGSWAGPISFSTDYSRMQLPGIRVARVIQTTPTFDDPLHFNLTLPQLTQLESVLTTAKAHLNQSKDNPDAIVIHTIQALHAKPDLHNSNTEGLAVLLDLLTRAKNYLHQHSEEHEVQLLSLIRHLPSHEQELAETIVSGDRLCRRAVCLVDDNRICLAPPHSQPGDVIVLFRGGDTLYVIRPSDSNFLYIGDAYMYGLMNGELTETAGFENSIEMFSLI